jgi:competence protein ComEC
MQNTYVYWRAGHPLVFISFHLLAGILLTLWYGKIQNGLGPFYAILLIGGTQLLLMVLSILKKQTWLVSFFISIILFCWGIAIQWASPQLSIIQFQVPTSFILDCRNWVIEKINYTIPNKEANGFALAILLGVKMDINQSLINAYTQLGIVHIIAISGMHLDILFKNLAKITQLLPRNKLYLLIELLLLLFSVWIYTLMAFASPSIVRACIFFTIYTIGKYMGAAVFTLNVIAAGILILLLVQPNGIFHIGLQLSYAAVIGIHLFYPLLYQSMTLKNPMIQFLWSNCCVSIAAQLTTLPILALYFHQIAGWVLVSNFIMVPLSNIILYGLALLLLLPNQFSISLFWGQYIQKYIIGFNELVRGWFLYTQAETIQLKMNNTTILVYYLILLCLYLWLYFKNARYLLGILGSCILYYLIKLFS